MEKARGVRSAPQTFYSQKRWDDAWDPPTTKGTGGKRKANDRQNQDRTNSAPSPRRERGTLTPKTTQQKGMNRMRDTEQPFQSKRYAFRYFVWPVSRLFLFFLLGVMVIEWCNPETVFPPPRNSPRDPGHFAYQGDVFGNDAPLRTPGVRWTLSRNPLSIFDTKCLRFGPIVQGQPSFLMLDETVNNFDSTHRVAWDAFNQVFVGNWSSNDSITDYTVCSVKTHTISWMEIQSPLLFKGNQSPLSQPPLQDASIQRTPVEKRVRRLGELPYGFHTSRQAVLNLFLILIVSIMAVTFNFITGAGAHYPDNAFLFSMFMIIFAMMSEPFWDIFLSKEIRHSDSCLQMMCGLYGILFSFETSATLTVTFNNILFNKPSRSRRI